MELVLMEYGARQFLHLWPTVQWYDAPRCVFTKT